MPQNTANDACLAATRRSQLQQLDSRLLELLAERVALLKGGPPSEEPLEQFVELAQPSPSWPRAIG